MGKNLPAFLEQHQWNGWRFIFLVDIAPIIYWAVSMSLQFLPKGTAIFYGKLWCCQ
jgi:hypothetical protein